MQFALLNASTDPTITRAVLEQIAAAITVQLHRDYSDLWQAAGADVRVIDHPTDAGAPDEECVVTITDQGDVPNALGWHMYDPNGGANAVIAWGPIKDSGGTLFQTANSLAVTISHEILEVMSDPYTDWWADRAVNDNADLEQEPLEIADRTEADAYPIEEPAGTITYVSNFLGPRAFRQGAKGPYDRMGLLQSPEEVRPGGYYQRRNLTTGAIDAVFGEEYPEHKKAQKLAETSRLAKRKKKHERRKPTIPGPPSTPAPAAA